ncbi:MAG: helix-turn-helix domain-containing protein [Myxococcota bacterium]|nr:helix-turn-helix domain-containing protein [Myxococcota bacterium]
MCSADRLRSLWVWEGTSISVGLREKKKQRQREAILAAAVELSRVRGFDALRVRDLIAELEISEATFFNYFPSKAALLDTWLEDELARAFASDLDEKRSLRAALRMRVRRLAEQARRCDGIGATAWYSARIQIAARLATPRCDLAREFEAAREAGDLRRDAEPALLAEWLVGSVAVAISSALSTERDPVVAALGSADLILDGARRRHERVRLGASATQPRA